MALDVSALSDFNNEVAGKVVPKMIFEGYTTSILPIQEGIKYEEPLNIFEVDLVVQSGDCVSTPSGSFDATQRTIQVTQRTSFDGLCLDNLNPKYLGISALDRGSYNETFKLASVYTEQIVNQMKKSDDSFLWNTTNGLGALTSGSTAGVVVPAGLAATPVVVADILGIIDDLIINLSDDVADRDDLTVWMSVASFRKYVTALRTLNNYFFDPGSISNRTGILQMAYPFQNVKVVGTAGITGERICLMPDAYAVVGTDLLSDVDNFSLWFDINADQLKHRLKSKLGVQVAFPEYIVSNDRN
tara:strand:- start:206 stop:1108 length:903 start_codon:yes stop_codon:yes gene_type:complete